MIAHCPEQPENTRSFGTVRYCLSLSLSIFSPRRKPLKTRARVYTQWLLNHRIWPIGLCDHEICVELITVSSLQPFWLKTTANPSPNAREPTTLVMLVRNDFLVYHQHRPQPQKLTLVSNKLNMRYFVTYSPAHRIHLVRNCKSKWISTLDKLIFINLMKHELARLYTYLFVPKCSNIPVCST